MHRNRATTALTQYYCFVTECNLPTNADSIGLSRVLVVAVGFILQGLLS